MADMTSELKNGGPSGPQIAAEDPKRENNSDKPKRPLDPEREARIKESLAKNALARAARELDEANKSGDLEWIKTATANHKALLGQLESLNGTYHDNPLTQTKEVAMSEGQSDPPAYGRSKSGAFNWRHPGVIVGVILIIAIIGYKGWQKWKSNPQQQVATTMSEQRLQDTSIATTNGQATATADTAKLREAAAKLLRERNTAIREKNNALAALAASQAQLKKLEAGSTKPAVAPLKTTSHTATRPTVKSTATTVHTATVPAGQRPTATRAPVSHRRVHYAQGNGITTPRTSPSVDSFDQETSWANENRQAGSGNANQTNWGEPRWISSSCRRSSYVSQDHDGIRDRCQLGNGNVPHLWMLGQNFI